MVHFCLTGGNTNDCTQAAKLLATISPKAVLADKAYDSKEIADVIEAKGATVVIPSQSTRKTQRTIDAELYKARNKIERLFCKMKGFRRVATRYDKLDGRFAGFLLIVCAVIR